MGAGKTSVGRALAERLNWAFEDLDDHIQRREQRTVADIFRDSGEREFRRAEHTALKDILNPAHSGQKIIALGGGAFVQKDNADLLKASGMPTVFLDAPVDELWRRCCAQADENGAERPLLRNREHFRELYDTRRRSYQKAALHIRTGNRAVDQIAAQIAGKLNLRKIEIRTLEGEVE